MSILRLKNELEREKRRLNTLCEKWQNIVDDKRNQIHNEDIKGSILSVVGNID